MFKLLGFILKTPNFHFFHLREMAPKKKDIKNKEAIKEKLSKKESVLEKLTQEESLFGELLEANQKAITKAKKSKIEQKSEKKN